MYTLSTIATLSSLALLTSAEVVLNAEERAQAIDELQAWKNSAAGTYARANGFYTEAFTVNALDDQLNRFLATKAEVARLSKENPDAVFSTDSPFSLLTNEEFEQFVKRSYGPTQKIPLNDGRLSIVNESLEAAAPKASGVDWTTQSKCVAPIKNQGSCGSCWAFAGVASAEYASCVKNGKLSLYSEQQVTSCSSDKGSQGCNGGWSDGAIQYIAKNGICLGTEYPYTSGSTGQTGSCKQVNCKKSIGIKQANYVKSGEAELTAALNKQPVVVYVSAGNSVWKQYRGGVVTCPSAQIDHAVFNVGYGADASNKAYYKIKNSWGTSWGDKGFIYLSRGVGGQGACKVASSPIFAS